MFQYDFSQVFQQPLLLGALLGLCWEVMTSWGLATCMVAALKLLTLDMEPRNSKGSIST